MILGLCGSQGSGKTTITQFLTGEGQQLVKPQPIDPKTYVLEQLDMSSDQITPLMKKWVDPDWSWEWCSRCISDSPSSQVDNWVEVSLADPLKKVCSVLFNYHYPILLGNTETTRMIREKLTTYHYSVAGAMTGRQLLQYFGTEVIRNNIASDFWANLAEKRINKLSTNVIVSDVRFPEERELISRLGGFLIRIERGHDTQTTQTHISEMHWKNFSYDFLLVNDGTIKELKTKFQRLLKRFQQRQDQHSD